MGKKIIKELKQIKWENVVTLIMIILFTISLINHIIINGFYFNLITELVVDLIFILAIRFTIKESKTNR